MLEFDIISAKNPANVYNTLVIRNYAYNKPSMHMLFDTGAGIPVWVGGLTSFADSFPNNRRTDIFAIMRGFGHGYEYAPVFIIPEFVIQDEQGNSVMIQNLYVAVIKRDFSFKMLLSFPTLEQMNYHYISYTDRNNVYKKIKPLLRIYPYRNIYYMNISSTPITNETINVLKEEYPDIKSFINMTHYRYMLNYVYTFAQN